MTQAEAIKLLLPFVQILQVQQCGGYGNLLSCKVCNAYIRQDSDHKKYCAAVRALKLLRKKHGIKTTL